MSVQHSAWVWTHSRAKGGTLLVALALADSVNSLSGDGECWPKRAVLAQRARLSEAQVSRCLKELVELGEIEKQRTDSGNRYRFVAFGGAGGALCANVLSTPMSHAMSHEGHMPCDTHATCNVEPEVESEKNQKEPPGEASSSETQLFETPSAERTVWEHWLKATGTRQKLDATRKRVIRDALKLRTVEQCCSAIDGLAGDSWWRENRPHLELRYAFRGNHAKGESDEERIDSMITKVTTARRTLSNVPMTVEQWIERFQPQHRPLVHPDIIAPINAMLQNPDDRDLEDEGRRQLRRMWGYGAEPVIEDDRITGIKAKSSTAPEPPMFHRR